MRARSRELRSAERNARKAFRKPGPYQVLSEQLAELHATAAAIYEHRIEHDGERTDREQRIWEAAIDAAAACVYKAMEQHPWDGCRRRVLALKAQEPPVPNDAIDAEEKGDE